MKVVAVINQKGGVGKTTTTTNLCHALAEVGYKVTAIDFDPQGQLAISLGIITQDIGGIDEAMLAKKTALQQVIRVRHNLALVPAGPRLKDIEQLLAAGQPKGMVLKTALGSYFADQDFV
ncbi:ParA family protein, partial [Methylicorpusculum sp.]|uniref:ParA family protein n=1 Tax=Methylicorpusculum sp. TaxID=2713644 RepID=UPI002ABA3C10